MATKRSNPRKDFTQVAFAVVQQATGEVTAPAPSKKPGSGRKSSTKAPPIKQVKKARAG